MARKTRSTRPKFGEARGWYENNPNTGMGGKGANPERPDSVAPYIADTPSWVNATTGPDYDYEAAEQRQAAQEHRTQVKQERAEARQQRVIDQYVTKAFEPKQSRSPLGLDVSRNIEKAQSNVTKVRDALLSDPQVRAANAEGKVVGPKGLSKIRQVKAARADIEGPKGLKYTKEFGLAPKSLRITPAQGRKLQAAQDTNDGSVERTLARAEEKRREEEPFLGGLDDVVDTVGNVVGNVRQNQDLTNPGAKVAREFVEDEVENVGKVLKNRYDELGEGKYATFRAPTPEEIQALTLIPAGRGVGIGAKAVEKAAGLATREGAAAAAKRAAVVKSLPSEISDLVRATPRLLKGAPKAAKGAAKASPAALRGAARRSPAALGSGVKGTGKNLYGVGSIGAVGEVTNRAGMPIPIIENVPALVEGTTEAVANHPKEVLETTGRAIPGFITGPASLLEAAGESALTGSTEPLENTTSNLVDGTVDMFQALLSGDPELVEKTIQQETGLVPYLAAPGVVRQLHNSNAYTKGVRAPVRRAVEESRAARREKAIERNASDGLNAPENLGLFAARRQRNALKPPVAVPGSPGEHYVMRGLGGLLANNVDRRQVALDAARASEFANAWNQMETNRVRKGAQGPLGGLSPLARKMGPSYEAATSVMAKYGIPHTPEGAKLAQALEEFYGAPADVSRPSRAITDRMATHEALKNPEIFADKRHQSLTDEFREGQKRLAKELPRDYHAKPHRIQADFTNDVRIKAGKAPILKDNERITKRAHEFTSPEEAAKALRNLAAREARRADKEKAGQLVNAKGENAAVLRGKPYDVVKKWKALKDDDWVWVFHGTSPEVVAKAEQAGLRVGNTPHRGVRPRKNNAPSDGTYVTLSREYAEKYAKESGGSVLALRVRKRDLEELPEERGLPGGRTTGLVRYEQAIVKNVPADNVVSLERLERDGPSAIDQRVQELTTLADLQEKGFGLDGEQVSRVAAWAHYDELKAKASSLRQEARDARAAGNQSKANSLYRKARQVTTQKKQLYAELKSFARDPNKVDTSSLKGSGRAMKREFVNEQRQVASELGLTDPVHVHDEIPQAPGPKTSKGVTRSLPGRVQHFSTGSIARSGEADARFENVLHNSAIAPRTQIALNDLISQSLNDLKVPVRTKSGKYKHVLTDAERLWAENSHALPGGTEFFPTPLLKAALNGSHNLSAADAMRIVEEVRAADTPDGVAALVEKYPDLSDEIYAHNKGKGLTYTAVRSAGMDELVEQLKGAKSSKLNTIANVPTRIVLNDPAWVFAQLFATGIPIATALGPSALTHAPLAIRAMAQIQKMDPASQARIKAMIGSSPGVLGTPPGAFSQPDPFTNARAIKRSSFGRKLWNLANGNTMGKWDRWNSSKMREYAAAVRASKGFRNWFGGVKGLDKAMDEVVRATKGMSTAERLDFLAKNPKYARDIQKAVNKIGGNWQAFTALERKVAPFAVFYPWMRYSLTFVLYTFPVNHPVAATALAFLAQRNADELERIAAEEAEAAGVTDITEQSSLADILKYTSPVHRNADDEPVENPSGGRFSPLGVVAQTVLSGDELKTLQATNPWINTGISLATGTNTFTGQPLEGTLLENLGDQALSLSPTVRQAQSMIGFRGFAKDQPQSAWSKAYELLQGGKGKKRERSWLNPYTNRPVSKGALENALSKVGEKIGRTGSEAQAKVSGNLNQGSAQNKKEAELLVAENKEAWEEFERLLEVIDPSGELADRSREEYEHYKASLPPIGGSSKSGGIYGGGDSIYETDSIYEGDSIYGEDKEKNLQFKADDNEGVKLPNIDVDVPGLGVIGNLFTGTAKASTLPRDAQTNVAKEATAAKKSKKVLTRLHKRTLGKPPIEEVIRAGKEGKLGYEGGKITTPRTRKALKRLKTAQREWDSKVVPQIGELSSGGGSTEFAKWFSHYSGLDPRVVGAWVLAEGAGETGNTGGEAGRENWLAADYPAEKTVTSQAPFFNGTPKRAAKATVEWMRGELPEPYTSGSDGIRRVLETAPGKSPEQQAAILASSGWVDGNEGTLNQGYYESILGNMATIQVSPGKGAPKALKQKLKSAQKEAKALGISLEPEATSYGPKPAKKRKGEWAGTKDILLNAARGITISSEKRTPAENEAVGGAEDSDHLTTNENTFATDLPATGSEGTAIMEQVAKRLKIQPIPGSYEWQVSPKYPGYRFQLLWEVDGHFDHVHVGAEWTGEDLPAGTILGGTTEGAGSVGAGSGVPISSGAPVTGGIPGLSSSEATTKDKKQKRESVAAPTPAEQLELIEQISAGDLGGLGVPSGTDAVGPSLADLQNIAAAIESARRKLAVR